ncbi:DinI-like family protein [Limnobaculum parvum]|uniref:DNA damage-inducible protein I n=1 Tax=Limnobaculum parvum TaxID=2172103 RepID=A0A2Y9U1D1_9GAMM|nr:DinI-like family protein [Limnobaculum parvum]AWH89833.1 DNA damage-inducible protein I [Limnobaculum parvum]
MQVEISIRKEDPLPGGAEAALKEELEKRLLCHFADVRVRVRRGTANDVTVLGGMKTDKELVTEILQQTWESADDWFEAYQ